MRGLTAALDVLLDITRVENFMGFRFHLIKLVHLKLLKNSDKKVKQDRDNEEFRRLDSRRD